MCNRLHTYNVGERGGTMGILEDVRNEIRRDADFSRPRLILTDQVAALENVSGIVLLSENSVTVSHGFAKPTHTSIVGEKLTIKEIGEGRILISGKIQRAEFL